MQLGSALLASAVLICLSGGEVEARQILQVRQTLGLTYLSIQIHPWT